MLFKLLKSGKVFDGLEPLPFSDFAGHGQLEKDLENLLANNLFEILFEGDQLMPVFQERQRQAEADVYALDRNGTLVIFELKRATAGGNAVDQALRYCENAAQWDYNQLQNKYATYTNGTVVDLQTEHQLSFDLDIPLSKNAFNQNQRLMVVGSSSNDGLIRKIDYWRSKGIAIEFVPYRIYEINNEQYFEFFSPPYDRHANPAHQKGVLFDTCRTHMDDSIWYMCENSRVAAFGGQKHIVNYLGIGDTVFLYHKGEGIVAAGRVTSKAKDDVERGETMYCDVEWKTPIPSSDHHKAMNAGMIKQVLGHNFFWAKTIKTPYLSVDESNKLLEAVVNYLG